MNSKPMTKPASLHAALKKHFGFDTFKGDQEAIISNLLQGKDTFVLMPTGGGKSLCYQLPSLLMEGTAIVISPLIALMKNQVDVMNQLSDRDGVAHHLNSSMNKSAIDQAKRDIRNGVCKLLYVAPESLAKEENIEFLRTIKISFYAIDEAHCISEWGHDFRPEYRNIRPTINRIGNAPVIALTATATDKVRMDIKKSLGIQDCTDFKSSFNRPNLFYRICPKTNNVDKDIILFIRQHPGKSGIIYCLSRKKVEELAEVLKANDIKAAPYHAGLDNALRNQTQDDFLMEKLDVIVATIAFGMGIDKPDVRFVIHYDIPKSLEGYYQETGRAGRDGGEGICITYYSRKDLRKLVKFMETKPVSEQDIGRQLLQETAAYAETSMCRRWMLLHYFGENYPKDNCGNCDNCLQERPKVEAGAQLKKALEIILELKENYNTTYLVDFLCGKENNEIVSRKHETHEKFGCGHDIEPKLWNAVVRYALIEGYLRKDVDAYGVLKVTEQGYKFIESPCTFMVSEDREYNQEYDDPLEGEGGTSALDEQLQSILHDLRRKVARQQKCPPYVIFQDVSLELMATYYPTTIDEMKSIQGVGEGKVKKPYITQFINVIKKYCLENDIQPNIDLRVKTVAKRSARKIRIIQNIDRHVPLEDVAKACGITFDELLDEIEGIVYFSGTKLNLDYDIDETIAPDIVDEIYEYFDTADTDDLDTALDELGSDFSEEEIRLVRLKYFSEKAY